MKNISTKKIYKYLKLTLKKEETIKKKLIKMKKFQINLDVEL